MFSAPSLCLSGISITTKDTKKAQSSTKAYIYIPLGVIKKITTPPGVFCSAGIARCT